MSLLLIYTPQNAAYLKEVLDAMVSLLGSETFKSAKDIISILAVGFVGFQYVLGKKIQAISRYVVISFLYLFCILGIKVPVAIIDMQRAESAGSALTVDHVPLGVALPASLISTMGYGLTQVFSDFFHMTNDLDYIKSGMLFGSRTWLASASSNLSQSPELSRDLSSYIRQCVFSAKLLGSQQISPEALKNSEDLISLYFAQPSPIYHVLMHNGDNLSCIDAAKRLKPQLTNGVQKQLGHLAKLLSEGDSAKFGNALAAAHTYYMKVSQDAATTLTQNVLINATRGAALDAFAFAGADAEMMNFTNSTSLQKMHVAEANSFWMAGYRLPYYMTVFWILTVCIFPLVMLLALFPGMQNVYVVYLQSQVFLWSWPPLFIIIHFLVSLASELTLTPFASADGKVRVSFSTIDSIASIHSSFAFTAGGLAISVPVIAYFIAKGLPSVISSASQHLGGIVQSLSTSEAQSVTQGNISMATYSGWNMNYNNTHANKWDSNYQHLEGRATVQAENGALVSEGVEGSRVVNAQGAISQLATRLHASDRLSASLQDNATKAFHQSASHRSGAEAHYQQAISGLSQFSQTDANEVREGTGINKTLSNAFNQDIRHMQDAVDQYNEHHDKSGQVTVDAALTAKVNGGLAGAFARATIGASAEISGGIRGSKSSSFSVQDFLNSSEGQSFSNAFNHMEATAKNHHLEANDSFHLSQSEQIATNLSQGRSLSDLAAVEYSKAMTFQQSANQVREHSSSMDKVLDQAFHDWVVQRHGLAGEKVLLGADAASLASQEQLANEFMHSTQGKSALNEQVERFIKSSSSLSSKENFDNQRADLLTAQKDRIDASHAKGQFDVMQQSEERHLRKVYDSSLEQAYELRQNSKDDLTQEYQKQAISTQKAVQSAKTELSHRHERQKNAFVNNKAGKDD